MFQALRQSLYLCTIFLLVTSNLRAQHVQTFIDKDSLQVGDTFKYILVVEKGDQTADMDLPDETEMSSGELYFQSREVFRVSSTRDSLVYNVQFFGVDDTVIPSNDIVVTEEDGTSATLQSEEISIYFKTVIQEGEEEFRPLKPIFDFGRRIWPLLLLLLLSLLLGWIYYRYRMRHRTDPKKEPPPPVTPFIDPVRQLKEELDRLSGSASPLIRHDFEQFYIRLGDAIRQYFEHVYGIDALEMTSGEILYALRDYPADKEILEITRKVLQEADIVKFAKFSPDSSQAKSALQIAYRFADIVDEVDRSRINRLRERHENEQIRIRETENSNNKSDQHASSSADQSQKTFES